MPQLFNTCTGYLQIKDNTGGLNASIIQGGVFFLLQEYDKAVDKSDGKVKLATQIHDLVRQKYCSYMYMYITMEALRAGCQI